MPFRNARSPNSRGRLSLNLTTGPATKHQKGKPGKGSPRLEKKEKEKRKWKVEGRVRVYWLCLRCGTYLGKWVNCGKERRRGERTERKEVGDELTLTSLPLLPLPLPSLSAEPVFFCVLTPLMPIVRLWCCQLWVGIESSTLECGGVFFRHVFVSVARR